jgi:ABC-type transport system involved in multi-copper enzyme maturation permease subunit
LIGPLFWYDLARLARRNRTTLLRCTYALALLAWLWFGFGQSFPGYVRFSLATSGVRARAASQLDALALHYAMALLTVQGVAVWLLTPAYLASAIAEEKERGTFEYLLMTPLRNREIVLGKLFGRLGHMVGILLTGLPILSLVQLWGGVDASVILIGFLVTGLTLLSVGSLSLFCSVLAPNVLVAMLTSYGAVTLFALVCHAVPGCSSVTFFDQFESTFAEQMQAWQSSTALPVAPGVSRAGLGPPATLPPSAVTLLGGMALLCLVFHGAVFLIFTLLSIANLRPLAQPEYRRPWAPEVKLQLDGSASWGPFTETNRWPPPGPAITLPAQAVGTRALLWKEMYFGELSMAGRNPWRKLREQGGVLALVCLLSAVCVVAGYLISPKDTDQVVSVINNILRVVGVGAAAAWCTAAAFRAADSLARERQKGTLDVVLLLPLERRDLLGAKWLGCILRWRQIGYVLFAIGAIGLFTGALHPWAVLLTALLIGAYLIFLTSLGLWLGLASRNRLWANMTMALVLLLLVARMRFALGPGPGTGLQGYELADAMPLDFLDMVFNPFRTLWFAEFSWSELIAAVVQDSRAFGSQCLGLVAWSLALLFLSWILWLAARWRLAKHAAGH